MRPGPGGGWFLGVPLEAFEDSGNTNGFGLVDPLVVDELKELKFSIGKRLE